MSRAGRALERERAPETLPADRTASSRTMPSVIRHCRPRRWSLPTVREPAAANAAARARPDRIVRTLPAPLPRDANSTNSIGDADRLRRVEAYPKMSRLPVNTADEHRVASQPPWMMGRAQRRHPLPAEGRRDDHGQGNERRNMRGHPRVEHEVGDTEGHGRDDPDRQDPSFPDHLPSAGPGEPIRGRGIDVRLISIRRCSGLPSTQVRTMTAALAPSTIDRGGGVRAAAAVAATHTSTVDFKPASRC